MPDKSSFPALLCPHFLPSPSQWLCGQPLLSAPFFPQAAASRSHSSSNLSLNVALEKQASRDWWGKTFTCCYTKKRIYQHAEGSKDLYHQKVSTELQQSTDLISTDAGAGNRPAGRGASLRISLPRLHVLEAQMVKDVLLSRSCQELFLERRKKQEFVSETAEGWPREPCESTNSCTEAFQVLKCENRAPKACWYPRLGPLCVLSFSSAGLCERPALLQPINTLTLLKVITLCRGFSLTDHTRANNSWPQTNGM